MILNPNSTMSLLDMSDYPTPGSLVSSLSNSPSVLV